MSREVFELADSDAEDYLNFGQEEHKSAPVSSSSRNQEVRTNRPAQAASKSHTFLLGGDSDNVNEEDIVDYLDLPADPPMAEAPARRGRKPAAPAGRKAPAARTREIIRDYMSPANEENQEAAARKIPAKSVAEHQTLMMTLQRYAASQRFAPLFREAGLKLTNLESKTVAELKSLQIRVRTVCSNGGGATGFLSNMILGGSAAVESKVPKKIMNLDGFSSTLRADPEFEALCEMLELDMGFASSMTPMQRMGLCLGRNAIKVNEMNKSRDKLISDLMAQQGRQQQIYQAPPVIMQQAPPAPIPAAPIVQPIPPQNKPNSQPIRSNAIHVVYD